jgi:hypothetical protein
VASNMELLILYFLISVVSWFANKIVIGCQIRWLTGWLASSSRRTTIFRWGDSSGKAGRGHRNTRMSHPHQFYLFCRRGLLEQNRIVMLGYVDDNASSQGPLLCKKTTRPLWTHKCKQWERIHRSK